MVVDTVAATGPAPAEPSQHRGRGPTAPSHHHITIVTAANVPSLVYGQAMGWLVVCLYCSL